MPESILPACEAGGLADRRDSPGRLDAAGAAGAAAAAGGRNRKRRRSVRTTPTAAGRSVAIPTALAPDSPLVIAGLDQGLTRQSIILMKKLFVSMDTRVEP